MKHVYIYSGKYTLQYNINSDTHTFLKNEPRPAPNIFLKLYNNLYIFIIM